MSQKGFAFLEKRKIVENRGKIQLDFLNIERHIKKFYCQLPLYLIYYYKKKEGKQLNGKGPVAFFLKVFFRSIIIVAILLGVGIGSYQLTLHYYKLNEVEVDDKMQQVIKEIVSDAKVEEISKNLIFSINDETGRIIHVVLEIFNTNTNQLDYVTIPATTRFAISNKLYQQLCTANSEVPQIVQLSEIYTYLKEENRYEYGCLLIQDLFDIEISYYTVFKESDYKKIFQTSKKKITYEKIDDQTKETIMTSDIYKIQTFQKEFQQKYSQFTDKSLLENYLEELNGMTKSNLTLKNKLKYLDSYIKVKPEQIHFYSIYGDRNTERFTVEIESSKQLIHSLLTEGELNNPTKEEEDNTEQPEYSSSKELAIYIYNGSKINGLAAAYREKLSADGYTIAGINNYNGAVLTNTKIITKEEGRGYDLLSYFDDAIIEAGTPPTGADIQIILGTNDRLE